MKFIPASKATWTERIASLMSTLRNSWPRDDAPKLMTDRFSPVFPSGRCCITAVSVIGRHRPFESFHGLRRGRVRIGVGDGFGGKIAVVSNLAQRSHCRCQIDVPLAGRPAIAIHKMDVADLPASSPNGF